MLNQSLYSSEKADWSTPQALFNQLNSIYSFELDVCATKDNAKCQNYFSIDDDGLQQEWSGICWMNPPYGRGIDKWVRKAFEETRKPNCLCVCLVPVRSDTKWWHQYVMKSAKILFLSRRLSFEGSTNKAPFPAAIVVFSSTAQHPVVETLEI